MKKLMLHGWATGPFIWNALNIEATGDSALTMPGHGNSVNNAKWSEPNLEAPLELIEKEYQGEKIDGIGWSLGGLTLLQAAALSPEKINSLVLFGVSPCYTKKDDFPFGKSPALTRRMLMDLSSEMSGTLKRFFKLNFTKEEQELSEVTRTIDLLEENIKNLDKVSILNSLKALIRTDIRSELCKVECPVLIIHGSRDEVCDKRSAEYLNDNLNNSELSLIDKAGHAPFITMPKEVTEIMTKFFERM
ncbi:MAG: alpha/beta fold hydrolase [Deltaproteobacteria bacterium]|nr:alpha/beta fold hydrolase [Deltaproteobacteria bacterium]